MQMRSIRGRNIVSAGYDPVDGILAVQFAKSGLYRFKGVPENIWVSLRRVPFPDKYFTQTVKGKYPVEKPEKPTEQPQPRKATEMEFFRKEDGLTFEEQGHVYKFEGKRVMSLTQILDAAGLVDYSMVQPAVLEAKRGLGSKVHEYCLWNDKNELDMDDLKPWPKYWNRVEGWRQFVADSGFMPDLTWCEVPAAARVNGMLYALTVDRYGVVGDGENIANAVIEIKTCADKEPSHQIQTAGQAILFRPQSDAVQLPLKRFAVYLLEKANGAGKFYAVQEHTDRMDEKIFLACLMLTHYRLNNGLLKG